MTKMVILNLALTSPPIVILHIYGNFREGAGQTALKREESKDDICGKFGESLQKTRVEPSATVWHCATTPPPPHFPCWGGGEAGLDGGCGIKTCST
jgi:hypothetical protein